MNSIKELKQHLKLQIRQQKKYLAVADDNGDYNFLNGTIVAYEEVLILTKQIEKKNKNKR